VSSILGAVLKQCGLQERVHERGPLLSWPQIVGAKIAEHSRAVDISDGVLILEADHGAWRQEVSLLTPMIIKKFNALHGEGTVTEIQWRDRPGQSRKRFPRK
jgi:predicted nucleic acid-binding Zn ribbon protein